MKKRIWPQTDKEAMQQNLSRRIPREKVHLLMPTENEIYLYPDPKMTLAEDHERTRDLIGGTDYFIAYEKILQQIDPERALLIGDFGNGSDAPLALDYRMAPDDPPVIGLKWNDDDYKNLHVHGDSGWVELAPSFTQFVAELDLWSLAELER